MSIENFPSQLQGIIQQNFLEREFLAGLESRLGYRAVADREPFPNAIGETVTKTRRGLKTPVTTPMTPTSNTNFDNGLTPTTWSVEQYVLSIAMFADTIDLNMVTERVGIANQFMQNAKVNGTQAKQSLDRLARNALFGNSGGVGGYLGGNTRVITTLGAAAATIHVDDIRGFQQVFNSEGQLVSVSGTNTMSVTVGSDVYTLIGATADGSNISTAPNGVSGTLTFSANVTIADGTTPNAVVSSVAPAVFRPNGRLTTAALVSTDTLTMAAMQDAVAQLRMNNVPDIDGSYNCYLDDQQMVGLFRDPDFKELYRASPDLPKEYQRGRVFELLGARYITTTESPQQASLGAGPIRRALLLGQGALVEGDFSGMAADDIPDADRSLISKVDDVIMVTREPMDRLRQIIAQSWYWIGGFALPTDMTANANVIPTASNAYLKRGVIIESV
jgi:hypothetical protein